MAAKRLKVFQARLGFYDTIVAAPSQKAALAAWGAKPGEFAKGFASVSTDPRTVEQAMALPGQVLKRPIGSNGPFKLVADPVPAPKSSARPRAAAKATSEKKRRRAEQRRIIERELKEARQQELRELMELRKREAALEMEKSALRERTERRIARAKARLGGARR